MKQRQYLETEKRLWENCFKSGNKEIKVNEFRKVIRDICETVINGNDIRRSLPEGLTEEELQIVREEAAVLGLNIVTSSRFGKELLYLQKSKA